MDILECNSIGEWLEALKRGNLGARCRGRSSLRYEWHPNVQKIRCFDGGGTLDYQDEAWYFSNYYDVFDEYGLGVLSRIIVGGE